MRSLKMLKNNLVESVKYIGKDYGSIRDVLFAYYENKKAEYELAVYRGKFMILSIEDSKEDISLFENLQRQIDTINDMF